MIAKAFEIFLNTLAVSLGVGVFALVIAHIFNKYFNDSYKKKVKKEKKTRSVEPETHELAEKALNFKTPKIETSFGDQRIGEVHGYEKKD